MAELGALLAGGAVTPGEFLDAPCGIDELGLAGKIGVAGRANTNPEFALGAADVISGAAGAGDRGFLVVGMNICFHGSEKEVGG